jgi:peptidoglycan/LPS O-acetylase OafA/YrhL
MAGVRLILALCVVLVHLQWYFPQVLNGYTILDGLTAVQSFFMISGFYMALIIEEKYGKTNRPYLLYITNRALRIYPIYWVVLGLTFLVDPRVINFFDVIKNILLVSTPDYFVWIKSIYDRLLVGQAWTLGIELTFYLVAPLLTKGNFKKTTGIVLVAFILRVILWRTNFYPPNDADYFFLPNLVFFMLGILAYKLHGWLKRFQISNKIIVMVTVLFVVLTLLVPYLPNWLNWHHMREWMYYLELFLAIPFLFRADQIVQGKLWHLLGDIAYPIYISHLLVLTVLMNNLKNISIVLALVGVVGFSIFLLYMVANPIDKIRDRRVKENVVK